MNKPTMKAPLMVVGHNRRFIDWKRRNSHIFNDEELTCILENAYAITEQLRENGLSARLIRETLDLVALLVLENRLHVPTAEEVAEALATSAAKETAKPAVAIAAKIAEVGSENEAPK